MFKSKLSSLFAKVKDHYHQKEDRRRLKKEKEQELREFERIISKFAEVPDEEDAPPAFWHAVKNLPTLKAELQEISQQFDHHKNQYLTIIDDVTALTRQIPSKISKNSDLDQTVQDFARKNLLEISLKEASTVRKALEIERTNERKVLSNLDSDAKAVVRYLIGVLTQQASVLGFLDPEAQISEPNQQLFQSYTSAVKVADVSFHEGFNKALSLIQTKPVISTSLVSTEVKRADVFPSTPHTPGPVARVFPTSPFASPRETTLNEPWAVSENLFSPVNEAISPQLDTVTKAGLNSDRNSNEKQFDSSKWAEKVNHVSHLHREKSRRNNQERSDDPRQKPVFRRRPLTSVPVKGVSLTKEDEFKGLSSSRRHSLGPSVKTNPDVPPKKPAVSARDLSKRLARARRNTMGPTDKKNENVVRNSSNNVGMATLKSKFSELEELNSKLRKNDQPVAKNVKFSLSEITSS
ncbi:hypothetical protein GEMRC1_003895 [Eukaryota sp. GEM-RC1]